MLPTDPYEKYRTLLSGYIRSREQALVLREIILSNKQRIGIWTLAKAVEKYGIEFGRLGKIISGLEFVGVDRHYSRTKHLSGVANRWYGSKDAEVVVRVLDEMLSLPAFAPPASPPVKFPPVRELPAKKELRFYEKFLVKLGKLFKRGKP
ncbi:MAG: hypothetical protein QME59_07110 [Candidatus Hydrothermarchaeota archaeon]|nr:hypothetical protein [Candidatus Hydrothermarchaeota archaeon]